jgi:membrane fusion protein (multidrug efflux system)
MPMPIEPAGTPTGMVVSLQKPAETVLLVGFEAGEAQALAGALRAEGVLARAAGDREEALALLARREIGVVCLGAGLPGWAALEFLRRAAAGEPAPGRAHVVLAAGPDPRIFQELLDEDRIFYLSRAPLAPADLTGLLRAAVGHRRRALETAPAPDGDAAAAVAPEVGALLRELARETDPRRGASLLARAARRTAGADRAACLLHDPGAQSYHDPEADPGGEEAESTAAGVIGFALRTGRAVRLDRLGDDPRCDPEADGRGGPPDQRLLVLPLAATEAGAPPPPPWGALAALRDPGREPFSAADEARLRLLAERAAPLLGPLAHRENAAGRGDEGGGAGGGGLFRDEAVAFHARELGARGSPLQVSPRWARRAYALLLAVFALGLAYATFGSLDEYAAGPAVVRVDGVAAVTARAAGTVVEIAVAPGERVERDRLLVRLDDGAEAAALARVERELELAVEARLADPADRGPEALLHSLHAERELARARLDQRAVRAPEAGVVSELRVRPGQHVAPGEILLALAGERARRTLVVAFPSRYRPLLRPGAPLRLELDGYPRAYQQLVIERIGDQAMGPAEARRVLGGEIGDAVPLAAPVVFAYAPLPAGAFEVAGRAYPYHEGLQGTAEARVRSQRILSALIPGLEGLLPAREE